MRVDARPLAVVAGLSTELGRRLAMLFVQHDFELIVSAEDELPRMAPRAESARSRVQVVQCDPGTPHGLERLLERIGGRVVHTLVVDRPSRLLSHVTAGRILVTDSSQRFEAESLDRLCSGDFLDSFSWALRDQLAALRVSVTRLSAVAVHASLVGHEISRYAARAPTRSARRVAPRTHEQMAHLSAPPP